MNLYDRYIDKIIVEKNLPDQIDFGRFCLIEDGDSCPKDITYSNISTNKTIKQELLLEKNKNIQDIFIDIAIDIEKTRNDNFCVIPLVRRIKNKLNLNVFERLLYEKIFHLEEIFRLPHYLLEREIEKVQVSRAKRIPSKSYQYLASHTEDWIHKSIVNFKPSRILNEELELNFDIYENQLTIAFIERCLIYLNSRLKEIQDIKVFHLMYQALLKKDFSTGWYGKKHRNFKLMGFAYDDENYKSDDGINDQNILNETEKVLNHLTKRLLLLRKSNLFDLVNKRVAQSISLRNTNVLVNHKHYRYLSLLWDALHSDNVMPEKSIERKKEHEQEVMSGLKAYVKSIITYSLKNNLDYELSGNYKSFTGQNTLLSKFKFIETNKGVFQLEIGKYIIEFVIIGNLPILDEKINSILKNKHTYILYYDEQISSTNTRLIQINPLDPDSVERVGGLIRKYLLLEYLDSINKEYEFKHLLKEYIKYIPTEFAIFNPINYTYKFHTFPKKKLSHEDIKKEIESDQIFKTKSRPDKDIILSSITYLYNEIELNAEALKSEYLKCFNCGEKLHSHYIEKLNYVKCPTCSCLIDSSISDKVVMKIDDVKYNTVKPAEFGIDYLIINKSEI